MVIDKSQIWLALGIIFIIAGGMLLVDFLIDFALLVLGIIMIMIGLQLIGYARRPRVRIK